MGPSERSAGVHITLPIGPEATINEPSGRSGGRGSTEEGARPADPPGWFPPFKTLQGAPSRCQRQTRRIPDCRSGWRSLPAMSTLMITPVIERIADDGLAVTRANCARFGSGAELLPCSVLVTYCQTDSVWGIVAWTKRGGGDEEANSPRVRVWTGRRKERRNAGQVAAGEARREAGEETEQGVSGLRCFAPRAL